MLIKVTMERKRLQDLGSGGVVDFVVDTANDWACVRFGPKELAYVKHKDFTNTSGLIVVPDHVLAMQPGLVKEWASQWPLRYFAGSVRPPEGTILMADGSKMRQDGNS